MTQAPRRLAFSATGVLFAILGLGALLVPFMTIAANRIVEGDGMRIWNIATPSATLPGVAAVIAGLLLGLPDNMTRARLAGAVMGLAGLVWLLVQGAPALLEGAGPMPAYRRRQDSGACWVYSCCWSPMRWRVWRRAR